MTTDNDYVYEGSDLLRLGEELKNYNRAIATLVAANISPTNDVLDFGAGFGTLTRAVAERVRRPDCVEPDTRQRESLRSQGFVCYETIEAVPSGTYDAIYSSNVLEHIEDDVAALVQLHRVLRPGGKVILYLPAFQSLYTTVDAAIGHYRRYDATMVRARLEQAGFKVESTFYVDLLGYLVSWLFKRLSNQVGSVNPRTMRIYDGVVFPVSRFIERFLQAPFGKNVFAVAVRSTDG
jgi:SAM-dependent methyltransferase